jgi:hypothetical protein
MVFVPKKIIWRWIILHNGELHNCYYLILNFIRILFKSRSSKVGRDL